jgi:hemerythrin
MLVHNKAINVLSPTDYLIIEKEHNLLEKYLSDLGEACSCSHLEILPDCQSCDHGKQTSCQGRLPSFLFHIIDLASKHFDHEETIMLSRPHVTEEYEYFRVHHQAHVDIIQNLQVLANECLSLRNQGSPAEIYRKFYEKISAMFGEHDQRFDDPFIESTKPKIDQTKLEG